MSKITKSAKGQECQVRIYGYCCGNPETTVAAHINRKGLHGMGCKTSDILTVRACDTCHSVIDSRIQTGYSREEIDSMVLDALCRTIIKYEKEGLIKQ